jgi:hypothetical protein
VGSDDWWPQCLDADADTVKEIDDELAKTQTEYSKQRVREALADPSDPDLERRRSAACQLAALASEAWLSQGHAREKRGAAQTGQRVAAGASAALAAGTGGALAAGLKGLPAHVFGIVVLVAGIGTAAVSALSPDAEYQRNRAKVRQYEQLRRDIWAYMTLTLPTAEPESIEGRCQQFNATFAAIGSP